LLESRRLRLRELTDADFEAVHEYGSDPEVVQFMNWGPNTEQDTRDFLERAQNAALAEPRLTYDLAVVSKESGRLLGAIGFYVAPEAFQAMLGYCYSAGSWGRGYATEAAETVIRFGFDVLMLNRIWAGCDPDNAASIRVLEKTGMTLEGRLREDVRIRGEFRDSLVYGVLEREWRRWVERPSQGSPARREAHDA